MLWIRDILVWIRIRGSVPLTNGSGSGSYYSSAYYFMKVHLHHLSNIKSHKKTQNSRNHGFSYYFCLMEGSGAGSVPLSTKSGSRRPKNIRILRIRIHKTASKYMQGYQHLLQKKKKVEVALVQRSRIENPRRAEC
jgi:hypothetical protein